MLVYNLMEYSSNYSDEAGFLWFYSKDEGTTFDVDIVNNNTLNLFKAKFLGNKVANGNNTVLKNVTIPVPLKYFSSFWRSLEMPLINCKVELKLRWIEHCVLAAAGVENDNANSNNIIFTIKETKIFVPVATLSAKDNRKP